jgi:hypothetical protein
MPESHKTNRARSTGREPLPWVIAALVVIIAAMIIAGMAGGLGGASRNSLDQKVSRRYGTSEIGCHVVNKSVPDHNLVVCEDVTGGGQAFDYNAETEEVY